MKGNKHIYQNVRAIPLSKDFFPGRVHERNAAMTKSFSHSDVSEELYPVAGAPVIRQLSKQRGEDGQHKVLICEAEGSPKPIVSWSINGTSVCTHSHS